MLKRWWCAERVAMDVLMTLTVSGIVAVLVVSAVLYLRADDGHVCTFQREAVVRRGDRVWITPWRGCVLDTQAGRQAELNPWGTP